MSTQTSTSISRASPTPGASPGNNGSFFSPGASPPLILAFLAIGLFAVSMIGIFGWRRIQYATGQRTWPLEGDRSSVDLGDTPKLWDMWTNRTTSPPTQQNDENEATWENIVPVAVIAISEKDYVAASDAAASPRITSFPRQHHLWVPRPRLAAPRPAEKADDKQSSSDNGNPRRLQVAVAIAMPSQRKYNPRRNHDCCEGSDDGDDRLEYSLGVYHCAWTHEKR